MARRKVAASKVVAEKAPEKSDEKTRTDTSKGQPASSSSARKSGRRTASAKTRSVRRKSAKATAKKKSVVRKPRRVSARPVTKKATRQSFTPAERQRILATAMSEGLTGAQVAKKFGISQVTYYLWRKKAKSGSTRRDKALATGEAVGRTVARVVNLADMIRQELRAQIQRILPEVIASEVGNAFGGGRRPQRKRSG